MMHYFWTKIKKIPIPNYGTTKVIANSIKQAVWHVKPSLEFSMAVIHTIVFMGFCLSTVWRSSSSCCSDKLSAFAVLLLIFYFHRMKYILYIYIYLYSLKSLWLHRYRDTYIQTNINKEAKKQKRKKKKTTEKHK